MNYNSGEIMKKNNKKYIFMDTIYHNRLYNNLLVFIKICFDEPNVASN